MDNYTIYIEFKPMRNLLCLYAPQKWKLKKIKNYLEKEEQIKIKRIIVKEEYN